MLFKPPRRTNQMNGGKAGLMAEENYLEKIKRVKSREREQLSSLDTTRPSIEDFWTQPRAVRLIFVEGNVLEKVASTVRGRGAKVVEQRIGSMEAFPANVGTLLSRRRRGRWSVAVAAWFSDGWTKIQETRGGTISTDEEQLALIASAFSATTVSIFYDAMEESVGLVIVQLQWRHYKPNLFDNGFETPHRQPVRSSIGCRSHTHRLDGYFEEHRHRYRIAHYSSPSHDHDSQYHRFLTEKMFGSHLSIAGQHAQRFARSRKARLRYRSSFHQKPATMEMQTARSGGNPSLGDRTGSIEIQTHRQP